MNGTSIEYGYDKLSRLTSVKNKLASGEVFSSFDYTYDKVGNRKSMTSDEGLHQYIYDRTYQLEDVIYPDLRTSHYEYDLMGNRTYTDDKGEHVDYTLSPSTNMPGKFLDRYGTVSKTSQNIDIEGTVKGDEPTVSVNGVDAVVAGQSFFAEDVTLDVTLHEGTNLIIAEGTDLSGTLSHTIELTLATSGEKFFTYDENGSIVGEVFQKEEVAHEVAHYSYDYENRLISYSSPTTTATYTYDYLGRRIEKNVDGTITRYIYDGANVIAEYDATDTLIAKYIYGPGIDEPIRIETLAQGPQICYYHYDALGSVTDLSNSSGQHIEHYTYSPFGVTKIYNPTTGMKRQDSVISNPYRFTARRWDEESQLYYYRARMYDPKLGRFLQTDPIGYYAGDLNLYRYCGNNPLNFVDPQGHIAEQVRRYIEAAKNAWNTLTNWLQTPYSPNDGSAPFLRYDVTSWIFPRTNYLGWTKSGPGPVMSELDRYGKIHDERLRDTGSSCLHLWRKDVRNIHYDFFINDWYQDYQRRKEFPYYYK